MSAYRFFSLKSPLLLASSVLASFFILTAASASDVLTNRNDNSRSGVVSDETALTPANVGRLKILFQKNVNGQVYAQPLCVSNQLVFRHGFSQGNHDVVIVATEHGSVYTFDAVTGALYWQVSLLSPGFTFIHPAKDPNILCFTRQEPDDCITATPVIDRQAGTNGRIFVVAVETDGKGHYDYKLHALDLATGQDALTPAVVAASVTGNGPATTFPPATQRSRAGLLLSGGVIYIAFASYCDNPPYAGWLIGYKESDLSQVAVFSDNPNGSPASTFLPDGSGGGIWQGGLGPAADLTGLIYLATGNGPFDETLTTAGFPSNQDFGDSVLKLATNNGLNVSDYFTPFDELNDAENDHDVGSGGVVLLPPIFDTSGGAHNLAVTAGKDGNLFLLDRNNFGKFNPSANNVYQEIPGAVGAHGFTAAAFIQNSLYISGQITPIKRFVFDFTNPNKPVLNPTPAAQTVQHGFGFPGCTPAISSNSGLRVIVWAYENARMHAVLHAYDPVSLKELFNSGTQLPVGIVFAVPTVFSGKVYVGTSTSVVAFGL